MNGNILVQLVREDQGKFDGGIFTSIREAIKFSKNRGGIYSAWINVYVPERSFLQIGWSDSMEFIIDNSRENGRNYISESMEGYPIDSPMYRRISTENLIKKLKSIQKGE